MMLRGGSQQVPALLRKAALPSALVLLYVYSFPYFEALHSANELPRVYLTMAMVERQAFNIDPEMRLYQPALDTATYNNKLYSNKAPGMSMLAIPVYAALKLLHGGERVPLRSLVFWLRLGAATIPSLLFLLLLWRCLRELLVSREMQWLSLVGYGLGTMALVYGTLLIAHQLSALLIATSFILILLRHRGRAGRWAWVWAGLAAGSAVLTDYQTAFVGPPLFVYLLVRATPGQRWRAAAEFSLAAALPLGILLCYHWACFGSPLRTGYHYVTEPVFREWTSQGFLGLKKFSRARLREHLCSADGGLFYYSPILLAAFPGLGLMIWRRRLRAEGLFCASICLFYLVFIGALGLISGWDVGPRYITCALPFFWLPAAVLLDALSRRWYTAVLPVGLLCVSVVIYASANAVFPHYPDSFSNPWYDVTVRFALAGYLPYNLGWLCGLRGLASLVPYLAVLALVLAAPLLGGQRRWPARLALALGAVAIVAAVLFVQYRDLAARKQPVPYRFLPWLEQMWEPRYPGMARDRLMQPLGPAPLQR